LCVLLTTYYGDESRRMGWTGQRNVCRVWWENWKVRICLEDLGISGRILLIRILKNWDGWMWTGFNWLFIGTSGRVL
jgi:hypothetical protein